MAVAQRSTVTSQPPPVRQRQSGVKATRLIERLSGTTAKAVELLASRLAHPSALPPLAFAPKNIKPEYLPPDLGYLRCPRASPDTLEGLVHSILAGGGGSW
ncbi:MAG: hypothetical protein U0401_31200 [Anaerolineae bacterium]